MIEHSFCCRPIRYETSTAKAGEIREHLRACAGQFVPPLDQRVDLNEYADKIASLAITFEAWHQDRLVGLVAAYLNAAHESATESDRTAFITSVSVDAEFQNQGIGRKLVERCHCQASVIGFDAISLEVSKDNHSVIDWYARMGYLNQSVGSAMNKMTLQLSKPDE